MVCCRPKVKKDYLETEVLFQGGVKMKNFSWLLLMVFLVTVLGCAQPQSREIDRDETLRQRENARQQLRHR